MRIELLQIGDWVYIKDKDLNIYGNYRVECFGKHEEGYGIVVSRRQFVFFDDCVEPIPLTEKILEKNDWYFGLTSTKRVAKNVLAFLLNWKTIGHTTKVMEKYHYSSLTTPMAVC